MLKCKQMKEPLTKDAPEMLVKGGTPASQHTVVMKKKTVKEKAQKTLKSRKIHFRFTR